MTLEYAVNKCKYFCFANSLSSIKDQLPEDKTIYLTKDTFKDTNPEEQLNNILNIIKDLDSKNEYYFVIDSELEAFNEECIMNILKLSNLDNDKSIFPIEYSLITFGELNKPLVAKASITSLLLFFLRSNPAFLFPLTITN